MVGVIISSTVRDAGKITVHAQIEFSEKEFTPEQAESFVKSAIADAQNKAAALAAVRIDGVQAEINRQLGLSSVVFARYNTVGR